MPRPHRSPLRSTARPALAIVLVAALVALSSCSDAHSDAQLQLKNQGYDPTSMVILAPATLSQTLQDLGTAYTRLHPDTSFVLVSDVVAGLERFARHYHFLAGVAANARQSLDTQPVPDLWIDTSNSLRTLLPPGTAVYGDRRPFGDDHLAVVVRPGNPDHISGLQAFAASSGVRTGMCNPGTPCASLSNAVLEEHHIVAKPVVGETTGMELVTDLLQGRIKAVLVTTVDLANAVKNGAQVTVLPIQPPSTKVLTYATVTLDQDPVAAAFADWVATSPQAATILAYHGVTPPARSTS